MPTAKNGFHILNLHPKKYVFPKNTRILNANLLEKIRIFMNLKGTGYLKSSNFQLFLFILKMKLYVCRNLCENLRQI